MSQPNESILFISVLCFPHFHNSVKIVFFVFLFAFVPSKTVMISLGDDRLSCWKRQKLSSHEKNFHFVCVRAFELILFDSD